MDENAVKTVKVPRPVAASVVRLRAAVEKASAGGGPIRVEAQKARGKFTARERIHYLLDEGTFQELDLLVNTRATSFGLKDKEIPGDGVITGFGQINGREICVAQNLIFPKPKNCLVGSQRLLWKKVSHNSKRTGK